MKREFKIKVHDPITVDLLDRLCAVIGVDPDLAMKAPAKVLEGLEMTPSMAKGVIDVACVRTPNDWTSWPVSEAIALGELVATDFFTRTFSERATAQLAALMRSGIGSESPLSGVRALT